MNLRRQTLMCELPGRKTAATVVTSEEDMYALAIRISDRENVRARLYSEAVHICDARPRARVTTAACFRHCLFLSARSHCFARDLGTRRAGVDPFFPRAERGR